MSLCGNSAFADHLHALKPTVDTTGEGEPQKAEYSLSKSALKCLFGHFGCLYRILLIRSDLLSAETAKSTKYTPLDAF